jgi:hypothetical protein
MIYNVILFSSIVTAIAGAVCLWAWHAVSQVRRQLLTFDGFVGMHFES